MIESAITKGLITAAKVGIARQTGEIMAVGKCLTGKTAETAIVTAPFVAPGVVAGVVGGTIAHKVCDEPENRGVTSAVIGHYEF